MFIGEFQHNIDVKGRVAVPAKFRQQLGTGAIITRGLDGCLFVYTAKEWELLAEKIKSMSLLKSDARAFARLMFAGAVDVDIDSQGRILVPEYLRKYANLNKETFITGLFNRFEIWDKENWKKYKSKTESSSDDIAEKLGELGI
ncbi:MAG: division/cell wall cluster transcriptional repressor MraZ [Candidatus Pacebacteria bacterium]|nr:division/cell wall cluster transcriptional repressor MraZ [Candidatus Paceibacterota bacterium]